jgi:hypothetical protein
MQADDVCAMTYFRTMRNKAIIISEIMNSVEIYTITKLIHTIRGLYNDYNKMNY